LHRRWRFRAVLCHFVWLSRALEALGDGVLKLLDSHDVYAGRHARLRAEGLDATGFSTSVAEEMRGLGRADIVLVADEESAAIFRARGHPDVRVIGHIVSGRTRLIRDRGAVTAGYFASACAANAVNFVQLRQHVARPPLDLRLLVAGEICSTLSEPAPFSSAGRLDHSDSFYDQIDIALNPESRRARLSIKSVEAISQGVPLIATRAAMTGLPSYHALHRLEGAEEVGMCLRGTRFGTTLRHDLATASRRAARDYAAIVRAAARDVIAAMNG
jgi:hypothetical protein